VTGKTASSITESGVKNSQAFAAGEVTVVSEVTWEKKEFVFAANYRGDTSVVCGVAPLGGAPNSSKTPKTPGGQTQTSPLPPQQNLLGDVSALREMFTALNDEKVVACFGHNIFSIRHILSDAQRTLLDKLLRHDTQLIENGLRAIVRNYDKLFEYLTSLGVKAPSIISAAASIVLSADVIHGLEEDIPDIESIRRHMERARQWSIALDSDRIGFAVSTWLTRQTHKIHNAPVTNPAEIERICDVLRPFQDEFKWRLSLYEAQNLYYATELEMRTQAKPVSPEVYAAFRKLGKVLRFSDEALK
jgi:hypothetical protein